MKDLFKLPEEKGDIHAMILYEDYLIVTDGKSVYKFYMPPKTVWRKIHDFFLRGKDWLLE